MEFRMPARRVALLASTLYLLLAGGWVFVSNSLIGSSFLTPETAAWVHTYRGWGFVAFTALVLFIVLWRILGRPTGHNLIPVELTERGRSQAALHESRERNRLLLDHSKDMIFTVDVEGNVTWINRKGIQLAGLTGESSSNLVVDDLLSREWAEKIHSLLADPSGSQALMEEPAHETEVLGRSGSKVPAELTFQLLETESNSPEVAVVVRDLSDRKRLEEQLRHSQKMEIVGQLAGGIAHDFNNLITAILGFTQLALDDIDPKANVHRDLLEVAELADRASRLTRQLVTFSRRGRLEPAALDLNGLIEGTVKLMRPLIGPRIELRFHPAPGLQTVFVDPGQIDQVLINLIINSRDAMPAGGVITIETRNIEIQMQSKSKTDNLKPGQYAVVTVRDSGQGMEADTLERVFEPFFTTKGKGKGTGLGLSVAYGIVKQHGGMISVKSQPGHGSLFEFLIPQISDGQQVSLSAGTDLPRGTETLLVVDDEEQLRNLVERVLSQLGYQVIIAESPQQAAELVLRQGLNIDLLLTEFNSSGAEVHNMIEEFRRINPKLKLLYISDFVHKAHYATLSQSFFLPKPFAPATLARKVREILDLESAESPLTLD